MNRKARMYLLIGLVVAMLANLSTAKYSVLDAVWNWLGILPSTENDQAAAMKPLVDCLRSVDVEWRNAYTRYQKITSTQQSSDHDGRLVAIDTQGQRNKMMFAGQRSRIIACLPDEGDRQALARMLPGFSRYLTAWIRVSEVTETFNFYSYLLAPPLTAEEKEHLDPTFRPLAEDFLKESDQLRREIVAQDLRIRQVQLRQIEARFGQDQHWHLLNFMLQARLNLDQLTKASAEHNLTPTLLSGLIENVKAAHAAGTSYMQAHPATSSDKSVQGIWEHLHTPATDYFKALDSLRDDWTAQRDSLYLDDDLEKIQTTYDALLIRYNQEVRGRY